MNRVRAWVGAILLTVPGVGLADEKSNTIPPQNVPLGDGQPAEPPKPALTEPPLFVVTGADDLANRVVQREAEFIARKVAKRWGVQLPPLERKWRIVLKLEPGRTSGATTFTFEQGPKRVRSAEMSLVGNLENILRTQLPHEITHCVLAAHFGRPVPRWVDEGVAVLSESGKEQVDHDRRVRELVNAGRCLALRHLLPMKEYPRDLIVLYAQGHSLARFLHERDAKKLLPLVEASFADGWDRALKATYGFADADALEAAWLVWLRKPDSVLKVEATPRLPDYTVAPPDILRLTFAPRSVKLPKDGEFLIRPDGTVYLGQLGPAYVAGMTLSQASEAVRKELAKFVPDAKVTADVTAFNSKFFYIITDFAGPDEKVQRLPATGNETVLDAIAAVGGLSKDTKKKVWIARPAPPGSSEDQTLPVDWKGISTRGHTRTNYQILPGNRLYLLAEK